MGHGLHRRIQQHVFAPAIWIAVESLPLLTAACAPRAGNPVWPIPVPPQPVLEIVGDDIEKGPARVGSFVLASLGMAFLGITAAVPEFQKKQQF